MTAEHDPSYRPEIDGLRAVAILSVVFFHFGVPGFAGGFVGVDVFFVISGYLITRIIVREIERGSFSFVAFYERRARRLLPSLAVVLLATFVAGLFIMTPQDMADLSKSMAYALIFVANLFFADQGGYFDPSLDLAPLLHTWSLSVEEQFYIVWPLVLVLAGIAMPRRRRGLAIALFAASLAASVYLVVQKPLAAFYLPHTRIWELLAGCILALGAPRLGRGLSEAAAFLGLALIAVAIAAFDRNAEFPGLPALVPVAGAVLIIWSCENALPLAGRLLSAPPLVFIGLVSYAWYLWHWPVRVLYRYQVEHEPTLKEAAALIAVSFLLAVLCWRYIERPVRRNAWWRVRPHTLAAAGATSAVLILLAGAGYWTSGFVTRYPDIIQKFTPERLKEDTAAFKCPPMSVTRIVAGDVCRLWDAKDGAPGVLLWGDSHAGVMRGPFYELGRAANVTVSYVGRAACPPLIGAGRRRRYGGNENCSGLNAAVAELLKTRAFSDVVLVARWDYYAVGSGPGKSVALEQHYLQDAQSGPATLEENRAVVRRRLKETLDAIAAAGARAWIIMEAPFAGADVPHRLTRALMHGERPETLTGITAAEHSERRAFMSELVAGLPVRVIDPTPRFCDQGQCLVVADGAPLYFDDNHLSIYGARRLIPLLGDVFARGSSAASAGH